jgi:hypothetical protein
MPRAFDQGSLFRVTVSEDEVRSWKRRWPASGLKNKGYSFVFEKENGDLVDTSVGSSDDGAAAVAMSEDAQEWGERRLGLDTGHPTSGEWPWGKPAPIGARRNPSERSEYAAMVKRPGKFEGEQAYVPYFWDCYLDGGADGDDGKVLTFDVTDADRLLFPELSRRKRVRLVERDDGFVVEV